MTTTTTTKTKTKTNPGTGSYWDNTGLRQPEWNVLCNKFVPVQGKATTPVGEALRAASNLNYEMFNNGGWNAWEHGRFQGKFRDHIVLMRKIVSHDVMAEVSWYFSKHHAPVDWQKGCCFDQMIEEVYAWVVKELEKTPIVDHYDFAKTMMEWGQDRYHFHQRLGQYLINTLLPGQGAANADIFYEEDNHKAMDAFINRYVRFLKEKEAKP